MSKKPKVWWVTMGPEPYLATCQRCGEHVPMLPLPASIREAVLYLNYASARHAACPPREGG